LPKSLPFHITIETIPNPEGRMSNIDLDALTLDELKSLQKDLEKAIRSFEARQKAEARRAAEAVAREAGFSLAELLEAAPGKTPVAPKYRHPENPEITWSGRGRKPNWFVAALEQGQTAEDMLIA
jgi:DNA-binding protein H-NS